MRSRFSLSTVMVVAGLLLCALSWLGQPGQAAPRPHGPVAQQASPSASPTVTPSASPRVAPTPSPSPSAVRPKPRKPRKPGQHPELYRALRALRVARYALQVAPEEYGGRREAALKLVEQAEAEVKAALGK